MGGVFWLTDSLFWSSFVSAPSVIICGMSCIVHFWMHTSHLGVVVVRYVGGHISYARFFFIRVCCALWSLYSRYVVFILLRSLFVLSFGCIGIVVGGGGAVEPI